MDQASFERLYERSAPALRSYLRFSCKNATLADDLLQDTYVRLLRVDLPELGEKELKSYLYKTAKSVMMDYYRRNTREQRVIDTETDGEAVLPANSPDNHTPELPLDIQQVLSQLNERDQQLIWLAYVEGFSHREIAPVIGVKENSVRVLLLRARERMAEMLTDQGFGSKEAV